MTKWKKALLGNASNVFESASSKHEEAFKQKLKENRSYKQIGQLQVEVDFLKTVVTSSISLSRRMSLVEEDSQMTIKKQLEFKHQLSSITH